MMCRHLVIQWVLNSKKLTVLVFLEFSLDILLLFFWSSLVILSQAQVHVRHYENFILLSQECEYIDNSQ